MNRPVARVSEDAKIQLKAVIADSKELRGQKCKIPSLAAQMRGTFNESSFVCLGERLKPQVFSMRMFLLHPQYNAALVKLLKTIWDLIRMVIAQDPVLECAP